MSKPRVKAVAKLARRPNMTEIESAYADELDRRLFAREVHAWYAQPGSIRIGPNTHYRPDFEVVLPSGAIEFHEVKGRKGATFYAPEDSWLKVKVVADARPHYTIVVVWPLKGGGWGRREV